MSTVRHLEIKISEAGPTNMRVEPAVLQDSLKSLLKQGEVIEVDTVQTGNLKFYGLNDFGKPGDIARLRAFKDWHNMFLNFSQKNEHCGLILEKLLFDTVDNDLYHVIGAGPQFDDNGDLIKLPGAEVLSYGGKLIYKVESGAGFDQFLIHKDTDIPMGIEAKNKREWIYPASLEVWRMIARACTLECLPILVSRKLSYITRAGFFSNFGILGFQSQFQYFSNSVNALSKYRFKQNVIAKERLGFADIKLVKPTDTPPNHFLHFFNNILPAHVETYYNKFMENKDILSKYAIEKGMAENNMSQRDRYKLYQEFKEEAEYEDIDWEENNAETDPFDDGEDQFEFK
ncbi:hypothetical protein [Ornithinibacillus bavariensis]|uniref:hypothetical protein n=1 Tax=Ornithinibacillus bavariensis TaxID=545502 RepID=UPI000ED6BA5A|nr:hypothetical protein [Ornithinibacillus sp.]